MRTDGYFAPVCSVVAIPVSVVLCASPSSAEDYTGFDPWDSDLVE